MLHDTIPIDLAEFVPPSSPAFHQSMIASTARHAAGLIVTTDAAESSIRRELRRCGRADIPIFSENPPVTPIFALGADHDAELDGVPYFVITAPSSRAKTIFFCCMFGANWSTRRQGGSKAGRRGYSLASLRGRNRHSRALSVLKDHVIEVSGLSTPGLRRLLSNACGC